MTANELQTIFGDAELLKREQPYRAWFEDNPLPMWVFDLETCAFLEVNEAAIRHYRYGRQEFLTMTIKDIRPPEDVPRLLERIHIGYRGRTQKMTGRHRTKDGRLLDVEVYAQKGTWNGRRAELVQIHDISELKRAEEALRNLSARLLQLQDEERRRIARELHDVIGQNLSALLANLAIINESANKLESQAKAVLGECSSLAGETLSDIRTVSYLLHPPMLDEEGIGAAIDMYVEGFAQRSGIKVDVTVQDGLGRLSHELEIILFRVVQEALTNVHRHSGSATAKVHLARDCGRFILEVRDSGKGMLPEVLERVRRGMATVGVGIAGMRERVAQVDGELFVESTGQGTVITAIFPLDITEAGCS